MGEPKDGDGAEPADSSRRTEIMPAIVLPEDPPSDTLASYEDEKTDPGASQPE